MKFDIFSSVVCFFSALTAACSTQSVVKNKDAEIIYLKIGTKAIDVFNISDNWISHEDSDYLNRRDFEYGEFGGKISFCSNEDFYCLQGGISVAIPKGDFEKSQWKINGIECQSESLSPGEQNKTITCKRMSHSVTFVYSAEQGIISYIRSSQPERKYELMGSKGLFAQ